MLSQARYKNWGNTLEALREKKKQDRIRRMDEVEAAQRVIDQEEAHYQEAQRRVVIDRANRILYQETDKVKNFHSGLLLSSVLKEREAQLVLAQAKRDQRFAIENAWIGAAEEQRKAAIAKEEKEEGT